MDRQTKPTWSSREEEAEERLAQWDRMMGENFPEKLCFVCGMKHGEHGPECSGYHSAQAPWD